MSRSTSFKVEGIDALNKMFKALPNELKDSEVRRYLRFEAAPLASAIKRNMGSETGNLKKSVKVRSGKNKPDAVDVWVGVQNRNRLASHWHLYAFGTGERNIDSYKTSPSVRGRLKTDTSGNRGLTLKMSNGYAFVYRTGKMPANNVVDKVAANKETMVAQRTVKQIARFNEKTMKRLLAKYSI